jgi:arylsulfatase A-like enzyme
MCSLVDTHVGRILAALEEADLAGNTAVVFTSDHGDMMGSHGLLGKGYMFEESVRVPLLIRLPGQGGSGRHIRGPVSQLDVVPTLLEALGQPVPAALQGRSLLPAVRDGSDGLGRDVFIEWHGQGIGPQPFNLMFPDRPPARPDPSSLESECVRTVVTTDNWKLNVSSLGDHELYDLTDDPYECVNRIGDPEEAQRCSDMLARIRAWQAQSGDDLMKLPDSLTVPRG